ncbi:MAG: YkvA family protein [Hyphomicrobium sp.]
MFEKLRTFAKALKAEIAVLASALRDPRTPLAAKVLGVVIVAYAVSPIDLIPDFIPVLGYLDDLILLPLGLWAVRRMIPEHVMAEHRAKVPPGTRLTKSKTAALVIVAIWLISLAAVAHWLWGRAG